MNEKRKKLTKYEEKKNVMKEKFMKKRNEG